MGSIYNNYDLSPSVKNILLLDSEGQRVAVRYYTDEWPTLTHKLAFEKSVFHRTLKSNPRTEGCTKMPAFFLMLKLIMICSGDSDDLHFYVTGGEDENELILSTVLQGFFDAVSLILRNTVDKREALENLDLILLCLDEIVDGGIILETDPNVIAGKVASHSMDADAPLAEQGHSDIAGVIWIIGFGRGKAIMEENEPKHEINV
ncbi:hypothetical protein G4B88_022383 [Cannabis sativa]|uniref:Coatomer subunit zeta n=1 Tax=Cannabis sativa TaxID=3483 RepID=A0A7J6HY10_CANSA|nr:hypothetical protein G4B88_022383 [Cannabis sativa]